MNVALKRSRQHDAVTSERDSLKEELDTALAGDGERRDAAALALTLKSTQAMLEVRKIGNFTKFCKFLAVRTPPKRRKKRTPPAA